MFTTMTSDLIKYHAEHMALQHVMKEYKGRGGKAPYIPDLGTR
jgi:hypothetical protein